MDANVPLPCQTVAILSRGNARVKASVDGTGTLSRQANRFAMLIGPILGATSIVKIHGPLTDLGHPSSAARGQRHLCVL
jgi:hypothetical protein